MDQEVSPTALNTTRRKVIRVGLIAIACGLLAFGYYEFWLRRPIGFGPVGIAVDATPFSSIWSERDVLLLGLGDSITAGFGSSPGRSHFKLVEQGHLDDPADVRNLTLKKVLPHLRSKNAALSGTTSIELIEFSLPRQEPAAVETFGIVLLSTGGNDVIHHYGRTPPREGAMFGATVEQAEPWIDNYRHRLTMILEKIDALFPGGCEIFVMNIYDPTDGIGDSENAGLPAWKDGLEVLRRYNEVIAEVCNGRTNAHMIDIRGPFLGHGIHCRKFWKPFYQRHDPFYWYFDNLEDPNDRGYDAMRRLVLNEIALKVPARLSKLPSTQTAAQ